MHFYNDNDIMIKRFKCVNDMLHIHITTCINVVFFPDFYYDFVIELPFLLRTS